MYTIKVVVIGASGVGKTSIRNQYISGRFTSGYRATIGADFITKNLPHYNSQDETVTLQIWDTAGQERFSSLSSAFFRGADAAVLIFDVNQPDTLHALRRWWSDFREKAPVPDEELEDFCCVVVGNKIDVLDTSVSGGSAVGEVEAVQLIDDLVPLSSPPPPTIAVETIPETVTGEDEGVTAPALNGTSIEVARTKSIDIHAHRSRRRISQSRSRSRSTLFRGGTVGTMTTTHTIYHTPSSSVFDTFESALSSPVPTLPSSPSSPARTPRRVASASSISSAPTITPSLFARECATTASATPADAASPFNSFHLPPPPEKRPKLFFTSAKTGQGVPDVFEYVARRVVMRWEYEEALEARTLHMQDADDTIRLTQTNPDRGRMLSACCRS